MTSIIGWDEYIDKSKQLDIFLKLKLKFKSKFKG